MTVETLWEVAKIVYSIALICLGIAFLWALRWALPKVLLVGRQLAEALVVHANALRGNDNKNKQIDEIAADVKTIKAALETQKKAA